MQIMLKYSQPPAQFYKKMFWIEIWNDWNNLSALTEKLQLVYHTLKPKVLDVIKF